MNAVAKMQQNNYGPGNGEFVDDHYTFLFTKDDYTSLGFLPVGYYTHVAGLEAKVSDVTIPVVCKGDGNEALDTFWRCLENVSTVALTPAQSDTVPQRYPDATFAPTHTTWATSQAAPLRRCILSNLALATQCGTASCYASGGFSADCVMKGDVIFGGQQQWLSLCDAYDPASTKPSMAVWNSVFVGCQNAPKTLDGKDCGRNWQNDGQGPVPSDTRGVMVNMKLPELVLARISKPFLQRKSEENLQLGMMVPTTPLPADASVDDEPEDFLLAYDECSLRDALAKGTRIVLSSQHAILLNQPLVISRDNVIVLGLGVPVLRINTTSATISVTGKGCVLAGLLIEPGLRNVDTLLSWSGLNGRAYDLYTRVGGALPPMTVGCKTQLAITETAGLILENAWLWRADHDTTGGNPTCDPNKVGGQSGNLSEVGLHVSPGALLYCYGLASEHNSDQNVLWEGNGAVFFYQSELDYCPSDKFNSSGFQLALKDGGFFLGRGMGTYCFFPGSIAPTIPSGFTSTSSGKVDLDALVTVWLKNEGGIEHVYNQLGCKVSESTQQVAVYLPNIPTVPCHSPPPLYAARLWRGSALGHEGLNGSAWM